MLLLFMVPCLYKGEEKIFQDNICLKPRGKSGGKEPLGLSARATIEQCLEVGRLPYRSNG